ncbi:hypothetical protein EGW08_021553 [Elysia chlorotica]|uniref:Ubiquitin-like domain-containing protein n=1 Tax=Elysia chlorotica TaxID=188477 RepID=A0A433SND0_ELYCH|nr:hypothetical protein EGW08_021553 [Elysia chlorotica]
MPLIEGLGDEVTLIMATLLVCVVVTLAWFSTFTADLPALREVGITASISPSASPASIQSSSNSQPKPIQINNAETESVASSAPQSSQPQEARQSSQSSPSIRVKLKYMNETQRLVYTNPLATIGNFRRTHFQQELEEGDKWVRFIYNGQDLRDDEATLQAYQVGDNCTMHCLITNKRRTQTGQGGVSGSAGGLGAGDDEESDSMMGALMYPLFTLVLAVVWYFRLTYRQYFSPMSTVCLIGISFLLGLGYFSSVRTTAAAAAGNQQQQPQPQSAGTSNQSEQRRNQRAATTTGHVHAD